MWGCFVVVFLFVVVGLVLWDFINIFVVVIIIILSLRVDNKSISDTPPVNGCWCYCCWWSYSNCCWCCGSNCCWLSYVILMWSIQVHIYKSWWRGVVRLFFNLAQLYKSTKTKFTHNFFPNSFKNRFPYFRFHYWAPFELLISSSFLITMGV